LFFFYFFPYIALFRTQHRENKRISVNHPWWCMPGIPAQEDCEFEASLGYIERLCQKKGRRESKREKREREREKLHPVKVSELIRKEAEGMLEWSLP
jgi:hypothetical protein